MTSGETTSVMAGGVSTSGTTARWLQISSSRNHQEDTRRTYEKLHSKCPIYDDECLFRFADSGRSPLASVLAPLLPETFTPLAQQAQVPLTLPHPLDNIRALLITQEYFWVGVSVIAAVFISLREAYHLPACLLLLFILFHDLVRLTI